MQPIKSTKQLELLIAMLMYSLLSWAYELIMRIIISNISNGVPYDLFQNGRRWYMQKHKKYQEVIIKLSNIFFILL